MTEVVEDLDKLVEYNKVVFDEVGNDIEGHGLNYSEVALDHAQHPRNLNTDDNGNMILKEFDGNVIMGKAGGAQCGDMVVVWLKLSDDLSTVEDCRWRSFGCYGSISSSSYISELIKGEPVDDNLWKLKSKKAVEDLNLPQIKIHCSVILPQAIKYALDNSLPKLKKIREEKSTEDLYK